MNKASFAFLLIFSLPPASAQKTVITGVLDSANFTYAGISYFNSLSIPSEKQILCPVENKKFKYYFNIETPSLINLFNSYLFLLPGDSIHVRIGSDVRASVSTTDYINNIFLKYQKKFDSAGFKFWDTFQHNFFIKTYIGYVNALEQEAINALQTFIRSNKLFTNDYDAIFQNYFKSHSLFLYSLPFCSSEIPPANKDSMFQYSVQKFLEYSGYGYINRTKFFDIALSNCFIRGFYEKHKSIGPLVQIPAWNMFDDTLKRAIAVRFIKGISDNDITVNKTDLSELKQIICNGSLSPIYNFCDYYHTKIDFSELTLSEICKNDYLIKADGKKIKAETYFRNKDIYIDMWASWCAPCITFLRELDMHKVAADTGLSLIFLNVDADEMKWRKSSKELLIPLATDFQLNDGLSSNLAKMLDIDHIPFIIHIKDNKVDILNASKATFQELFKD